MRFLKKPVEIEAIQWTGDNHDEVLAFTGGADHPNRQPYFMLATRFPPDYFGDRSITAAVWDRLHSTWVGMHTGDHVIKGVQGEFYPCKPDIFAATYEPVEDQ